MTHTKVGNKHKQYSRVGLEYRTKSIYIYKQATEALKEILSEQMYLLVFLDLRH